MSTLSFQQQLMLGTHYGIVLLRAVADGRAFFHYIMSDRKAIEQIRRDYETGKERVDYASYGEILYSGWGEPTPEEEAMVKKKWGQG